MDQQTTILVVDDEARIRRLIRMYLEREDFLIEEAENRARKVLTDKADDLEMLAQALLEYETLSGKDVDSLLRGDGVFRPDLKEGGSDNNIKSSVPTSGEGAKKEPGKGYDRDLSPQPEG